MTLIFAIIYPICHLIFLRLGCGNLTDSLKMSISPDILAKFSALLRNVLENDAKPYSDLEGVNM